MSQTGEEREGQRVRPGALSALLAELVGGPAKEHGQRWDQVLRPGAVVGRFELVRELGRGGFGVVYEARDRDLGRSVAFKAVRAGDRPEPFEERLLREAEAAARLSHPNIVTLFDVGRSEHGPYLVLELLRGRTLAERMDQGPIAVRETLRIAVEVAKGLAHAHAHGVVHRDLSPANVFLCHDGQVKVLDLGMAHAFGHRKLEGGTPAYMAPEQWRGAPEDERTDVFALGVIVHHLLAHELPFPDDGGRSTRGPLAAPELSVPDAPALGPLVSRMLEKDPVERPRDAGEVLSALTSVQEELERMRSPASAAPVTVRRRPAWRRAAVAAAAAVAVAAVAAPLALRWREGRNEGAPGAAEASIAVLPLVDMSAQKDQEYLSDGVAEEILNALTQVDGLRVAGRTSSFSFKGRNVTIADVGRALHVRSVLEGSVRKAGNRVRITAQIVDVAGGHRLWTQEFDRDLADIFAVQDEIARAVVDALKVKLLPGGAPSTKERRTASTEAYAHYLLGRHLYNQSSTLGERRAAEAFERALALDPNYAPAHAWLAVAVLDMCAESDTAEDAERLGRRAVDEAEKAVRLAPDLADGHSARSVIRNVLLRDWSGAEADAARAVALNPGDAPSHRRLGIALARRGRFPEAIAEVQRSTELDPLDAISWAWLGLVETARDRLDDARAAFARALQIAPESQFAHINLAVSSILRGEPAAAVAESRSIGKAERLLVIALAQHDLGHTGEAQQALDEFIAKRGHNAAGEIAAVHAWWGDRDRAFEWLDRMVERHRHFAPLADLKLDPLFRKLHGDPRWTALLKKLDLPAD